MKFAAALIVIGVSALFAIGPAAWFENIAAQSGFTRKFPNGGDESKRQIVETTGSGAAFFDYDNDGLPDAFVASGPGGTSRLYHNDGGGHFRDVTAAMGLEQQGWAQGVCAGDYDNDGFTDLFVTYWGANHLYRNIGGLRFEDVTARAHLTQDRVRYNTGCAFLDYDRDGHLDLFVANYLKFDPKTNPNPGDNPYCYYRGIPVNCGPRGLPFDRNILYRSNGDGTFTDVSDSSGISAPDRNYSLGVLTGDFNGDGLPDIYVACDQTPSLLYINRGGGKFEEEAVLRGVAFDANGKALSGMGAAAADVENKGRLDIFRTNFSDERETLYRALNERGDFEDATIPAGMGRNTRFVGWGCGFFDFDNDGWKDLLVVNGHVFPEVDRLHLDIHYKDRAILYRNLGNGKFEDISESSGPAVLEKHSARGAAFADFDNDGRVEVLIDNQNEAPSLWKQTAPNSNHWVILKLTGARSNRSAIGARVRLTAGGRTTLDEVRSGGGYLSQNDLRLHFGLGGADRVERVEIDWPSGVHQVVTGVAADRVVEIIESGAGGKPDASQAVEEFRKSNPDGESLLAAARILAAARPSLARKLFEEGARDPLPIATLVDAAIETAPDRVPGIIASSADKAAAHEAEIGYFLAKDDLGSALVAARRSGQAGYVALAAMEHLLSRLYLSRPEDGAALFSELLADLPAELDVHDLDFLSREMSRLTAAGPDLAVQAAHRLLKAPDGLRNRYLFEAGAYLHALDPVHYGTLAHLFEPWRDRLDRMKPGDLPALFPPAGLPPFAPEPKMPESAGLDQLRESLHAAWASVLPVEGLRGNLVLVDFWVSWCPPCRRQLPMLEKIGRDSKDLKILAVSAEPESVIRRFLSSNRIALPIVADAGQIESDFEITSFPVILILDRRGMLVKRIDGELPEADLVKELSKCSN